MKKIIKSKEYRANWLMKEAELLEDKIKFYDDLAFKIKGWTITIWTLLISYSLANNSYKIIFIALITIFCFLLVESSFKRYQIRFIERTRELMKILND